MKVFDNTTKRFFLTSWVSINHTDSSKPAVTQLRHLAPQSLGDFLQPLRRRIENIQINNPQIARRLCQLIPAQCPFERDIKLFGKTLFHIPPLCKLNPFFEEVVGLRFRALCYLADECGEDVSQYC
ncbi:Mo-dependent nitrogenase C-terminal domain-containing protein [Nodularia chucula]|uniref:Mo-dependent nitrogenase C-terminal domain-containing protein n=1 Tax=Nodularia chucula TaxID=3093667 RepID=UPI0039C5FBB3